MIGRGDRGRRKRRRKSVRVGQLRYRTAVGWDRSKSKPRLSLASTRDSANVTPSLSHDLSRYGGLSISGGNLLRKLSKVVNPIRLSSQPRKEREKRWPVCQRHAGTQVTLEV